MRRTFKMTWTASLLGLAATQLASTAGAQGPPVPAPVAATAAAPDPIVSSRQEHARLGVALSDNSQGKVWIKSIERNSSADEAGFAQRPDRVQERQADGRARRRASGSCTGAGPIEVRVEKYRHLEGFRDSGARSPRCWCARSSRWQPR